MLYSTEKYRHYFIITSDGVQFSSVQFSRSVMPDSLWPHGLQHTRLPCPSPTPGVYPNSCPLSWWCNPTISSSVVPFSFGLQSFQASGVFSNESALRIKWPKYWSFSISPSNEYSGLITFRIDWFDLTSQASLVAQLVQNPPVMWETWLWSLWEGPLEKGMATHSSILACRIPWTSPWGHKESDMTEQLSLQTLLQTSQA